MAFGFRKKKPKLDKDLLRSEIIMALKEIYDPEIPVNIYDLGLIYDIQISDTTDVHLQMTLTSPGCPVAQTFPGTVETAVCKVEGVNSCNVELVWEPMWTQDNMTEAAKLQLGLI